MFDITYYEREQREADIRGVLTWTFTTLEKVFSKQDILDLIILFLLYQKQEQNEYLENKVKQQRGLLMNSSRLTDDLNKMYYSVQMEHRNGEIILNLPRIIQILEQKQGTLNQTIVEVFTLIANITNDAEIKTWDDCFSVLLEVADIFATPPEIATLIAEIAETRQAIDIFDPACGTGELLKRTNNETKIYASDINSYSCFLTKVRFILLGKKFYFVQNSDSLIVEQFSKDKKFHVIVSEPPMLGSKVDVAMTEVPFFNLSEELLGKTKGDYLFLLKMLDNLREDGVLVCLIRQNILATAGVDTLIRTQLIQRNVIETIIYFPEGALKTTRIATALLVCRKNKKNETVQLIDATTSGITGKKGKTWRLTANDIIEIVANYQQKNESETTRILKNSEIESQDYRLKRELYFVKKTEEKKILSDIETELQLIELELEKIKQNKEKLKQKLLEGKRGNNT